MIKLCIKIIQFNYNKYKKIIIINIFILMKMIKFIDKNELIIIININN